MFGHPVVNLNLGIPSHVAYLVVFLALGTAPSVGAQHPTIHFAKPVKTHDIPYTPPLDSNITLGDHPYWYYASPKNGRPALSAGDRTFKFKRWGLRRLALPNFLRSRTDVYWIRLSKRIRRNETVELTNGAYLYHQPSRKWHP